MEGHWTKKRVWALMLLVVMSSSLRGTTGRSPVLHRVGGGTLGRQTSTSPNGPAASSSTSVIGSFHFEDFGFDKHRYNVLQVNKTSYEKCTDKVFITNITRGGRDVFNLIQAKPYYFLSGGGYCFHGMRLAISVKEAPKTDPAAAPHYTQPRNTSSAHNIPIKGAAVLMFLLILLICYR